VITERCGALGCRKPSVHIVYQVLVLHEYGKVVKVRYKFCVQHFNDCKFGEADEFSIRPSTQTMQKQHSTC
jgi:hypothetical protein